MHESWTDNLARALRRDNATAAWNPTPRLRTGRSPNSARNRWRALFASVLLGGPLAAGAEQVLLKLQPVPFRDVTIQDSFWAPRRETNRVASIPFSLQKLEEAGNLLLMFKKATAAGHVRERGCKVQV